MRKFTTFLLVGLWIIAFASAIWLLNIGAIKPIEGAQMFTRAELCLNDDCAHSEAAELPFYGPMRYSAEPETRQFRFDLTLDNVSDELQALYLPSYADEVFLRVNGVEIFGDRLRDRQPARMWNTPVLATVPPAILHKGNNQIEISLYGYPQEGLALEPFFFGPAQILKPHYNWRYFTSAGMARFNIGVMIIAGLMLSVLSLIRRKEPIYAVVATSCLLACIICFHFGFDTSGVGYRWWTLTWNTALSIYVFLVLKFTAHFLDEDLSSYEQASMLLIFAELVAGSLVPEQYVFETVMLFNLHPALLSFIVISILITKRHKIDSFDFRIFFVFMSVASATGAYELYMTTFQNPGRNQHLFQFMPLPMLCVWLWLIISRFMRSLKNYEELTATLQDTVAAKTEELQRTYEKLGRAERQKAIHDERQRIMLDLHDGIGGQLVNTLAYMQNRKAGDTVIQSALEDALRDLSLMLDSLETEASISTLLGMLRTRLEALLAEHDLEFDWRIDDEPELPNPGPSQNLTLLRIVQESITNIIKHAGASVITVASDRNSISVRDNGKGFDPSLEPDRKRHGHGLAGMRRRAANIGAEFDIESGNTGTEIRLVWR